MNERDFKQNHSSDLFTFTRVSERKKAVTEEKEWRTLKSIAKCPSCSGELEKGYAFSEGISFDTQKKRTIRGPKYLVTKYPLFWTVDTLPALRCHRCRIVIFDYSGRGRP